MFLFTGNSLESQLAKTGKGTKPHIIKVAQRLMANMLPIEPFVMFLFVRENSNSTDLSNKSCIISQKEFRIRQTPGLANALTQRYNQRSDSFHFSTLPLKMS